MITSSIPPASAAFIPPAPERAVKQAPRRMPGFDELPIPAQNELRLQRGELPPPEAPEKRRMGLLQRLAAVGLGSRREEAPAEAPGNVRAASVRPVAQRQPDRIPVRAVPRPPEPISDYARRAPHQGLDQHGRQAPVHNSVEEDQLDIPAFLRRQAN